MVDTNSKLVEPFGPLIVTHKEPKPIVRNRSSYIKYQRKNGEFSKLNSVTAQRSGFCFFNDHKNCMESEFYWKDQQHPKILRHYSKDKNKNKYKRLNNYWEVK